MINSFPQLCLPLLTMVFIIALIFPPACQLTQEEVCVILWVLGVLDRIVVNSYNDDIPMTSHKLMWSLDFNVSEIVREIACMTMVRVGGFWYAKRSCTN
jgi:hypothetical protein